MKDMTIQLPENFVAELITQEERNDEKRDGKKEQEVLNGIEAQTAVFNAGPEFWDSVYSWATRRRLLSGKEDGILQVARQMPTKIPTEKQSKNLIGVLARIKSEGYAQRFSQELDTLVRGL